MDTQARCVTVSVETPGPNASTRHPTTPSGTETLRHREGEVHGRDAVTKAPREAQAHDLGNAHGDGLSKRSGLGLDAADAPAKHTDAVSRGRVGVRAHDRVKARKLALAPPQRVSRDDLAEALDVELVADATSGRDYANVVKQAARPFEEREALAVAVRLDGKVVIERARTPRDVGCHRVVDDERAGNSRVNDARVSPALHHGVTHRGEVDEDRDAREVLEQDARGHELDLLARRALPRGIDDARGGKNGLLVGLRAAHHVLEKYDEACRQLVGPGNGGHINDATGFGPAARERPERALATALAKLVGSMVIPPLVMVLDSLHEVLVALVTRGKPDASVEKDVEYDKRDCPN